MAETLVTRRIPQLVDFLAKCAGEMIVKPLDGRGGEGIFHVRHDDRNLFSILEQATRFGKRRTMAQRYLPEVRRGDKRILLLDGEPLGALLRVPAEEIARISTSVGGPSARARRRRPSHHRALAPSLRRDGLFFVGST
jgi:glutathione synthase